MAYEIERKFIVVGDGWQQSTRSVVMRQSYLCASPSYAVRVRLAGDRAWFGVKAEQNGIQRLEYEYLIPVADAEEMLDRVCDGPSIEKTRHYFDYRGHTWEVDVFHGDNEGLIVAEVELGAIDEAVELPGWVGQEVSSDVRFYNAALVEHPFRDWTPAERDEFGRA